MDKHNPAHCGEWDPYRVWQILLHRHPVRIADVNGTSGRIERELLAEFCEAISDYPDFLQDALLLIAHAEGVEAATGSLDAAVREELAGTASLRRERLAPPAWRAQRAPVRCLRQWRKAP